jgi:probable DNA metabolism protein
VSRTASVGFAAERRSGNDAGLAMRQITLAHASDYEGWRAAARTLAAAQVPPAQVAFTISGTADLFAAPNTPPPEPTRALTVPKAFLDLAQAVVCHSDPERFALLYIGLTRLADTRTLLEDAADPLIHRLHILAKAVRRDIHKMRAFVRFRELPQPEHDTPRFVAWFEPDHHIVRINAPFFQRRFTAMRWSILTPELCAHWDGEAASFTPGATRADAPEGDPLEATWATYYASTFNPARLKVNAMTKEMPKKYWKNMPETALVPGLIAGAQARMQGMIDASPQAPPASPEHLPRATGQDMQDLSSPVHGEGGGATAGGGLAAHTTLAHLRAEAATCTRCPLWAPATQTVFGEGPADARLMFVGEQPGDQEDISGRPFIGPAGQMFDRALAAAGVDRTRAYVTNAVKHFKFIARGKRRIHEKPGTGEIEACRWWLDRERAALKPLITVALGATAARALTGRAVTIARERGRALTLADGSEAWITVHPSFLLRIEDKSAANEEFARFVADLIAVRDRLALLSRAAVSD